MVKTKRKNNFLATDYVVAGITRSWHSIGAVTIFCTLAAASLSFFDSNPAALLIILFTALITIIAMTIFYFVPLFAENVVFAPIPDLIFVSSVTVMAMNLKSDFNFLVLLLIVILAISAFSKELWSYSLTFLASMASLVAINTVRGGWESISSENAIVQFITVITFAVLFWVLASETNRLRRKESLEADKAKQLMDQKRSIYTMIDNLSEGIIAVDLERNITLVNKSVLGILGLTKHVEHYIGKNIDDVFISVSDKGKVSVVEIPLVENRPELRNDLSIIRDDLTVRLHSESRPIIDEHKRPAGAIVLFRDITAQSEMEEQRSEFLAIASHELRTPLTVIEGYLYYMTSDKSLKYDKKTGEYLAKTYQAAEDLLHLTNDILAVVKSEEGHLVVNLEKTDLRKVALETQAKFKDRAEKLGIKLLIDISDDLPELITDQQKIGEVLSNLLENALKFTEKGSVTIKAALSDRHEVVTSVIDTGIGISKIDQQSIFKKFYRSEDWQTRKTGGTGLGLYITKTYITRLGGKIGVSSKKGVGTTFWFSLPLTKSGKREHNEDAQLHEFISNI